MHRSHAVWPHACVSYLCVSMHHGRDKSVDDFFYRSDAQCRIKTLEALVHPKNEAP